MCLLSDRFLDDKAVVDAFKCVICKNVLCCPQHKKTYPKSKQDAHGHVYCEKCIVRYLGSHSVCPAVSCRIELDVESLQPLNTPSYETLKRLQLRCKYYNNGRGCRKEILLENIESHEKTCTHGPKKSKFKETDLTRAVRKGDWKLVKAVLTEHPNVNAKDYEMKTALIIAAIDDKRDIAELLVNENADLNAQDDEDKTALMHACNLGNVGIVKLLLNANAAVDMRDKEGRSALIFACIYGDKHIVRLLLIKNPDVHVKDDYSETALIIASKHGYKDIVAMLLRKEADVNFVEESGNTSIINTTSRSDVYLKSVEYLLAFKSNVNLPDKTGETPLMWASRHGNVMIVEQLLNDDNFNHDRDRVCNVNAKDHQGRTALMLACLNEHNRIVELLLEKRVYVDERDNDGNTALMHACYNGFFIIMGFLMKENTNKKINVDINARNKKGETPLIIAAARGYKCLVIHLLSQESCRINSQDKKGQNALMKACIYGHTLVALKLLTRNPEVKDSCNVNLKDNNGRTALALAASNGNKDIAKLLLQHNAQ